MAGDEEAERLLLVAEPFAFAPLRRRRHPLHARLGRLVRVEHAEEVRLALLGVALLLLPRLHRAVDRREQRGAARVERVERAALDEALDHAPVHGPEVHAVAEVEERAEPASLLPGPERR